jgi:hypothetical protein
MSLECPKYYSRNDDSESSCENCETGLSSSKEAMTLITITLAINIRALKIGSVVPERYEIIGNVENGRVEKSTGSKTKNSMKSCVNR